MALSSAQGMSLPPEVASVILAALSSSEDLRTVALVSRNLRTEAQRFLPTDSTRPSVMCATSTLAFLQLLYGAQSWLRWCENINKSPCSHLSQVLKEKRKIF